ncbi:30S ribosomal protein S18 [Patescibacteria group bacterium]|nr:30S ribosomal protein S18 [Patescibacteria group bacterium]MBU1029034.1 30S ribosomal protein S18 [Patescibacteria group bacterium]MBU1915655.1 30S ribosomal protein S18 [Patescibacteria group bacterium]
MRRRKGNEIIKRQRHCWFCINSVKAIDYKDLGTLRRYISSFGKIVPRRRSGVCAQHQRKLSNAIKRARIMALLPFTTR